MLRIGNASDIIQKGLPNTPANTDLGLGADSSQETQNIFFQQDSASYSKNEARKERAKELVSNFLTANLTSPVATNNCA